MGVCAVSCRHGEVRGRAPENVLHRTMQGLRGETGFLAMAAADGSVQFTRERWPMRAPHRRVAVAEDAPSGPRVLDRRRFGRPIRASPDLEAHARSAVTAAAAIAAGSRRARAGCVRGSRDAFRLLASRRSERGSKTEGDHRRCASVANRRNPRRDDGFALVRGSYTRPRHAFPPAAHRGATNRIACPPPGARRRVSVSVAVTSRVFRSNLKRFSPW